MSNHIMARGELLDEKGHLYECGYATSLVKKYDRSRIRGGKTRIKEWDYYYIGNDDYGIAMTIADNSYMGLIGASILDFRNAEEKTTNIMTAFPMGATRFPPSSEKGNVGVRTDRVMAEFLNDGRERRLHFKIKNFDGEKNLSASIKLVNLQDHESMVIAIPFKEKKTAFYYNQKLVGMKAEGFVRVGDDVYEFSKDDSCGILDWGRGVWTYDNTWYWGAAAGYVDGKSFGFNIGYGFGNTFAATENMLFYEGRAHKLDDVAFNIPLDNNGQERYMDKWTFTSSDGRFEMDFVPVLNRNNKTSVMVIMSDQNQVFGRFSGRAVLDDGTIITIKDFMGFAEKVRNKW